MNMVDVEKVMNAWIAVEEGVAFSEFPFPEFAFRLAGDPKLRTGLAVGDWVIFARRDGSLTRVGQVTRIRTDLGGLSVYLDRACEVEAGHDVAGCGLALPTKGSIGRVPWTDFEKAVLAATGKAVADLPVIENQAYIRELLQLAVMDDLLGPANGPHEQIVDMGVRDRYLVGKLAPQQGGTGVSGGIEGLEGPLESEPEEEPDDLEVHTGRHESGAEFERSTGRVDAEADAAEEIDAASNQSLVPSSLGMTFCVDGDVKTVEVEALWGKYVREYDHEHTKTVNKKIRDAEGNVVETRPEEMKVKVWQRVPCGGKVPISLSEGVLKPQKPDPDNPDVRIQGTVRGKNANGDRLVTLFIVNGQEEPEENKDSAWVFQPEIVVRAVDSEDHAAIFRRRLAISTNGDDPERDALEMVYRRQVEFAVGHGVAVHAETDAASVECAREVRTAIMPQYEVPVTETPGLRSEDRPAMQKMIADGHLDMQQLATMERNDLVAALRIIADDYAEWIVEQGKRVGSDVVGHDVQAAAALDRCKAIKRRLEEGISVLADPGD